MSLFIIIATRRADNVASAIKSSGLSNYELKDDAWLVSSKKTTKNLAETLGIRGGESGASLVCLVENYSGRLLSEAWEWIRAHENKDE
jgi:hypothetical protein